ncbi:hypothetical protein ACHWQZ_G002758 [Mnemiopsis leidyi]
MIKMHTAELKKLCTPLPEKPKSCIRQYTTNYVYPGSSVKHPLSREASLRLNVKDLELGPETESYFRDLVSANQNIRLSDLHPKTYEHFRLPKILRDLPVLLELSGDILTIHAKQCPTRKQNLSLCYYRLSGFIQEAIDLTPIYKELVLDKLVTDFVFDQDDAKKIRFQEKNFVELDESDDGGLLGLRGSQEAVESAEKVITEITEDVVSEKFDIPEPYTRYVTEKSSTFKELLSTHEAIYSHGNIVTFSDTLQNVKEDITDMLASLTHFTIPCPGHMTQFVLTPRFLEGIAANYDAVVTPGDNGVTPGDEPFLNVTVSAEYRDILTSLVAARIQSVKETTVTEDISCSQDINWERLSAQFDAHVTVSKDSISVTGTSETVKEVGFFVRQREKFIRSQTESA